MSFEIGVRTTCKIPKGVVFGSLPPRLIKQQNDMSLEGQKIGYVEVWATKQQADIQGFDTHRKTNAWKKNNENKKKQCMLMQTHTVHECNEEVYACEHQRDD